MNEITIGNRINKIRKEKHITIEEIAEKTGKSRATIYRYENGDIAKMPASIIFEIAKALGTTVEYLMGIENKDTFKELTQFATQRRQGDVGLLISNTSERLQYLMQTQNLKQVDILNKCLPICDKCKVKMGRNHICQYVSGKVKPNQEKLSILALALNVNETWLLGYDVPMTSGIEEIADNETKLKTAMRILQRSKKWNEEVGETIFSDEEIDELIDFAKYLISKRKW